MTAGLMNSWKDALTGVLVRHPNPAAKVELRLAQHGTDAYLHVKVVGVGDTKDLRHPLNLPISSVRLTFFPGDSLARRWLAAAWAGYLQHEALELVTLRGEVVLNPHEDPYSTCPWNRGLRDGFPNDLTPETLERALAVTMDPSVAREMALAQGA